MIVWINGTHGSGKTTTSALVQTLLPNSRVFDAEKVGETLMDITPGLPETDNYQRTGGMIGSLSHLVRGAAILAIDDGSERITRTLLDDIPVDHAATRTTPPRGKTSAGRGEVTT